MKYLKRLLALLLALGLCVSLALPAMAEESEEAPAEVVAQAVVNWDEFYFITQPQDVAVAYGESFTLSVEVSVPEGWEIASMCWYYHLEGQNWNNYIDEARDFVFTYSPGAQYYPVTLIPYKEASGRFCFGVTIIEGIDENGYWINNKKIYSELATVTIEAKRAMTVWDQIGAYLLNVFVSIIAAPVGAIMGFLAPPVVTFFASALLITAFSVIWLFPIVLALIPFLFILTPAALVFSPLGAVVGFIAGLIYGISVLFDPEKFL